MFQTKGYPVELLFNKNRMGKQLTSKPVERMQSTSSDSQTSWSEYEAFTDVVLNKLLEEHKLFSSDHHKTQLDIIKNYLWLAAIIASAIGAVLATKSFKEALQKPSLILRLENFHLLHRLNYCTNDCSGYF